MDAVTLVLALSVAAGFFMAFALGANDVSNAMAASVGSKALSLRQALVVAAILNCVGAIFLGAGVTSTIATGIIDPASVPDKFQFMLGMFAALLSAGLWVLIATLTGLPVSSTHSVVGGIIGLGLVLGGPELVNWSVMFKIVLSWICSPLLGVIISYVSFMHIRRYILFSRQVRKGAMRWVPFWVGLTALIIFLSFLSKTPAGKSMHLALWQTALLGAAFMFLTMVICYKILPRLLNRPGKDAKNIEGVFKRMQVGTASYVALCQGSNDVSNAIGPVAAIYMIYRQSGMLGAVEIPLWLLLMGGAGIAFGIFMMGHRVMSTVGERITKINHSRGFAVDFGAATTVMMATNLGMPVSSTHATIGAVVGVGLARGFAAVDFRVLGKIVLYWILTVPIAAFSCIVIYTLLRYLFS
ncbi:MAG: inorganic phosphate transporter [Deltaproteobacteria bacterium]|nr:inorganic phosphate transporter [Deltaproteobacteria bacterium]